MKTRFRWLLSASAVLGLTVATFPLTSRAFIHWRASAARRAMSDFLTDAASADEGWHLSALRKRLLGLGDTDAAERGEDPLRRRLAYQTMFGPPNPEHEARLARLAHEEAQRWPRSFRSSAPSNLSTPVSGHSWVNLGPTGAAFESNGGTVYPQVDSGRLTGVLVDPTAPSTVYVGTSGGGIWKSTDFPAPGSSSEPSWVAITEALGNLAIGAMDLDPQNPQTLYVGLGDFVDTRGGQMVKTVNGGSTWSAPVALTGGSAPTTALAVRAVKVDPNNAQVILVGTDVGLFRSGDGGNSYQYLDLPNKTGTVEEAIWSIVYTGQVSGVSHFAVSGITACDAGVVRPPAPGQANLVNGSNPPPNGCALGNFGDIWISANAGQTWSSRLAAGTLPASVGRITLGAGAPSVGAASTVIYAQLGNQDEWDGSAAAGYWKSTDSGTTFQALSGGLTNPPSGSQDCQDKGVADLQAWYNQSVSVDPTNDNHALFGGQLCGLRTLDGGASWQVVSHWLPASGQGTTPAGPLDYVHADWHASLLTVVNGVVRAFAGTDGGIFWSDSVFTASPPSATSIPWRFGNRGIVTHLAYSVASGDPAAGNAFVAFTGLQDNGTRMRDNAANPTLFSQIIGGDGFGAAINTDTPSGATMYWASVDGTQTHLSCNPAAADCSVEGNWTGNDPTVSGCSQDNPQFIVRYAAAPTSSSGPNTFISATDRTIARVSGAGTWQTISPCLVGRDGSPAIVRNLYASPNFDGVYGVALSGGRFGVTTNCQGANTGCVWAITTPLGVDANLDGSIDTSETMAFTSMLAIPPVTPTGKNLGDVFLAASTAPLMKDNTTLVPDKIGHLFITQDQGNTWAPFHGNGTQDLPNVPVTMVRYDPGDSTSQTIYVGTQLGVYRSIDGGQTWQRFGVGLPQVTITDMFISKTGALMRIATYGRGLWEIYPSASEDRGVAGNGDWDRNQQLDFVDLAAMASRLGQTPASNSQPYYDWADDIVGSVNQIDESDLTALMSRFGGTP